MAKVKTAEKTKTAPLAEPTKNAGAVATREDEAPKGLRLRIPYVHKAKELYGIDPFIWNVLISAVWPAAHTPEAIMLALAYCKGRNLDPMKKMVHIVPVWSRDAPGEKPGEKGGMIETVWPAIAEIRVTATRTGCYGGKDAAIFGKEITEELVEIDSRNDAVKEKVTVTYPEWCRVDVYRIVQGIRCKFEGPKVYWKESYATKSRWSPIPNEMWADRKSGQLEKCAEAASLRSAFPEELGGEYAAEEMWGRRADNLLPVQLAPPLADGEVRPKPNMQSEFKREEPKPKERDAPKAPAQTRTDMVDVPAEDENQDRGASPAAESQAPAKAIEEVPDEGSENARKELEAWLEEQVASLADKTSVPQVSGLRNKVAEQLPPGSDFEKRWHKACDDRQRAILDATKKGK